MSSAATLPGATLAAQAIVAAVAKAGKHRRHTAAVVPGLMADAEARDEGRAIANCALRLQYEASLGIAEGATAELVGARLCNRRLCPFCEWRRSRALRARLLTGLPAFFEAHPKHVPLMVTLTQRNVPVEALGDELRRIHRAWKLLTQREAFPTPFWYRRTEVTVNVPWRTSTPRRSRTVSAASTPMGQSAVGDCHPHIHALLLVPPRYFHHDYLSHAAWRELWRQCLEIDYDPVVDVRRAYVKEGEDTGPGLPFAATMEVSKYVTKQADLAALGPQIAEFSRQIKGVRMIGVSGALSPFIPAREVKTAELLDEGPRAMGLPGPFLRQVAVWSESLQSYVLTE